MILTKVKISHAMVIESSDEGVDGGEALRRGVAEIDL